MKKPWTYILIVSVLIIIGVLLFDLHQKGKLFPKKDHPKAPNPSNPKPSTLNCLKVLQKGMRGKEVKALQIWINDHRLTPMLPIAIDSAFGPQTESALFSLTQGSQVRLIDLPNSPCG